MVVKKLQQQNRSKTGRSEVVLLQRMVIFGYQALSWHKKKGRTSSNLSHSNKRYLQHSVATAVDHTTWKTSLRSD